MSDGTTVRRTVYFTMVNHPLKGWVPIRIADPNESIAVDPAEWLDRDEAVDPLEVAFWLYDEKHKRKDRALSERDAFKIVVRSFWNVESRALLEAFGIEVTTPEPVSIAEDLRQEAALAKAYQAAIQAHEKAKEQT